MDSKQDNALNVKAHINYQAQSALIKIHQVVMLLTKINKAINQLLQYIIRPLINAVIIALRAIYTWCYKRYHINALNVQQGTYKTSGAVDAMLTVKHANIQSFLVIRIVKNVLLGSNGLQHSAMIAYLIEIPFFIKCIKINIINISCINLSISKFNLYF